jgi:hypothetical protein
MREWGEGGGRWDLGNKNNGIIYKKIWRENKIIRKKRLGNEKK